MSPAIFFILLVTSANVRKIVRSIAAPSVSSLIVLFRLSKRLPSAAQASSAPSLPSPSLSPPPLPLSRAIHLRVASSPRWLLQSPLSRHPLVLGRAVCRSGTDRPPSPPPPPPPATGSRSGSNQWFRPTPPRVLWFTEWTVLYSLGLY